MAHLTFIWSIVSYLPYFSSAGRTGYKGGGALLQVITHIVAIAIPAYYAYGMNGKLLFFVIISSILATARNVSSATYTKRHGLPIELGCVAVVIWLAWVAASSQITMIRHIVSLPLAPRQLAVLQLSGSVVLFAMFAGATIVTHILELAGTLPDIPVEASDPIPSTVILSAGGSAINPPEKLDLRHGKIIGILERLIVVGAIAGAHFDSLGFLIAAKGLIRSKELEFRSRAEYFLVGTLASMAVSVVCGLIIAHLLQYGWPIVTPGH